MMTTSRGRAGRIDPANTMIRKVTFASCYVYSPSGSNVASERSRQLRAMLKSGDAHFIFKYAVRVRQQVTDTSPLTGYLCPTNVLIPIPGSARTGTGPASVAEHLAKALLQEGLGQAMWTGLQRIRAVRKSATAAPGSRPTVLNHYDSFAIEGAAALKEVTVPHQRMAALPQQRRVAAPPPQLATPPPQVVLIDDVVTKGRTLLAAATRVREVLPSAEIRAFALVRTMGLIHGIDQLLNPCVGEIRWWAGDAHRNP
jgi:hypothetical protein